MTALAVFIITFIFTTLCVGCLGYFVYLMLFAHRIAVQKRIKNIDPSLLSGSSYDQTLALLKKDKTWTSEEMFSDVPPLLNLPLLLQQAGMQQDAFLWLIKRLIFAGIAGLVCLFITQDIVIAFCVSVMSIVIPYVFIFMKRKKRLAAFEAGLAQALEIIGRSLRAGHPISMGLKMVSTELPDPIGMEFGRLFHEMQVGLPIEDALRSLARRVPLLDVRFFVLSIIIQHQTGGDLAEVLDNLSKVIRDRFKVLGQVKALTAEGRLSGWVLSILPFFVFCLILFINPQYVLLLLKSELGQRMLAISIIMQIIGMFVIRKIVNIKV